MKTQTAYTRNAVFFCGLIAAIFSFVSHSSAQTQLLPNLQALPAWSILLSGGRLYFNATSWNNGDGPLELVAREIDTASERQNVYQRIYSTDGTYSERMAGTYIWHEGHNHFHFEGYANYKLQSYNTPTASERTSQKTTFCVMDTTAVNLNLLGAPRNAVYSTCGNIVQGMSIGWGDTYTRNLSGQSIDVTGLSDGIYKLIIEVDPNKKLSEINDSDNTSCVLLQLNMSSSTFSVLNANDCNSASTPVAINTMDPNIIRQNSMKFVTITGSGFIQGMGVSFENGSGQRPVASNVTLVDSNTITAWVTTKKLTGKASDRLWDLRVGNGILVNALEVLR